MSSKLVRIVKIVLSVIGLACVYFAKIQQLPVNIILYALFLFFIIFSLVKNESEGKSESILLKRTTSETEDRDAVSIKSDWAVPRSLDEAYLAMRKQADELIKFQQSYNDEKQKNNTLREIAHQISVQKDISSLYRVILDRLRVEFNCHSAFIMSLDDGILKLQYSDGSVTDMTLRFLEISSLLDPLIKTGKSMRLGEEYSGRIIQAMAGSHDKINNLLCVPLKTQSDSSAFAVIGLANYMLKGDFTQEQEDFLNLIALEVAISIRNLGYINELERNYEETMLCLAQALEGRDKYTHGHVDRVRDLSEKLARELGLPEEEIKLIRRAATLHDVGKIATPDNILHKQAPLTDDEWIEMKKHAIMSAKILEPITSLPRCVIDMVLYHHERWDGRGYPYGLSSTDIPQGAQIIAVADAFDAMTTDRPYRRGMSFAEAIDKLRKESVGIQFRPDIINAFLNMMTRRLELSGNELSVDKGVGVGRIQRIIFNPVKPQS